MKRIRLNQNMILREAQRTVDRVKNEMFIFLSIEPIFGSSYTADLAGAIGREQFYVTATMNKRLWDLNKDSTQQSFVDNLHGFLKYYYPTVREYFAWQEKAETETVENPIPNGDPIVRMKPFPKQDRIDELKAEKVLGDGFSLFRSLYDRGITSFVLEEV